PCAARQDIWATTDDGVFEPRVGAELGSQIGGQAEGHFDTARPFADSDDAKRGCPTRDSRCPKPPVQSREKRLHRFDRYDLRRIHAVDSLPTRLRADTD